jgi:hypothetical protein
VSEEQNVVRQILREHFHDPDLNRAELKTLRDYLKQPLVGASVQELRDSLRDYRANSDIQELLGVVRQLYKEQGTLISEGERPQQAISRKDLHLVCFEYIYA